MSSGNDVNITLKARTDEFEAKFTKAIGTFQQAGLAGKDLNRTLANEFKSINIAATKFAGDLGKSFAALNIKTDFSLENQKKALELNARFFKAQYIKIASDGKSSADEVSRAFLAMNEKLQNLHLKFDTGKLPAMGDLHGEALAENKKYNEIRLANEIKTNQAALESTKQYFKSVANLHNETNSLEKGMVKIRLDAIAAVSKARAEQLAVEKKFNSDLAAARQKTNDKLVESVIVAKKKEQEITAITVAKEITAYKEAAAQISSYRLNNALQNISGGNLAGSDFTKGIQDRLQREQGLLVSRIGLVRETMSLESGLAKIRLDAIASAEKLRKVENNQARQRINDLAQLRVEEQSKYRSQAMSDSGSAAQLIGQLQAGASFAAQLKAQMEGVEKPVAAAAEKMNLFGLASIGAILKIQVLYSLVNTVMSAIGRAPGIAIDAVENYNASIIANAALITSMQRGVKDIGRAYQDNKRYAQSVQDVLIKMDAETAASGQNLTDMNRKFVEQGVLIDTNNKKQVDGFRNIANAIAALTSGQPNANMQYTQEISALMRGENRPSNKLFQMLNNMDNGKLAEHLELWKKIGIEQKNSGYVLEQLGPMLQGFAAAQGDINALWETTKSTMVTIRDQVLRKGFAPEFELIVKKMKELGKYAEENKEKIAAMMRAGFTGLNKTVENLSSIVSAFSFLAKPILWTTIGAGVVALTGGIVTMATAITAATGGLNLLLAAAVGGGLFVLKDFNDRIDKFNVIKQKLNVTIPSHGSSLPGSNLMLSSHGDVTVPTITGSSEEDDKLIKKKADAWKKLYSDLTFVSADFYKYQLTQINEQAKEFRAAGITEVKIQEWVVNEKKKLETDRLNYLKTNSKKELDLLKENLAEWNKLNTLGPTYHPIGGEILKSKGYDPYQNDTFMIGRVKQAKEEYDQFYKDIEDKAKAAAKEMSDAFKGWASNLSNNLNEVLWGAESTFSDILTSFGKMLTQMVIQKKIIEPGFTALENSGAFSAISAIFSNTATSSMNASGSAGFGAGWTPQARAAGGPVTAHKSYIVGEKRPELFTPGASGVITPYVPAGGGSVNNITIVNNTSAKATQSEKKNSSGGTDLLIMIDEAVSGLLTSGKSKSTKAFQRVYGMKPALGSR